MLPLLSFRVTQMLNVTYEFVSQHVVISSNLQFLILESNLQVEDLQCEYNKVRVGRIHQ